MSEKQNISPAKNLEIQEHWNFYPTQELLKKNIHSHKFDRINKIQYYFSGETNTI